MGIDAEERYYLKLKTAYYYYERNYNQQDISSMLGISRVTLSKFLKEAREEGIVKIEINDIRNIRHLLELEAEVQQKYRLRDVKIVDCINNDADEIRKKLGKAGALYFEGLLRDGMKIGISWGKTLELLVDNLRPNRGVKDLEIFTLVGGSGLLDFQIHANTLNQKLLNKYNGKSHLLYAPLIVENIEQYNALMENKDIKDIMEKVKRLDAALVGIGGELENSTVLGTGYFQKEYIKELKKCKATGDICARFFDEDGNRCDTEIDKKTIGIDLQDLKKVKTVVAVAGGQEKFESVKGALKGRFFNVLITDVFTAKKLLEV